jgi:hypothetical protein
MSALLHYCVSALTDLPAKMVHINVRTIRSWKFVCNWNRFYIFKSGRVRLHISVSCPVLLQLFCKAVFLSHRIIHYLNRHWLSRVVLDFIYLLSIDSLANSGSGKWTLLCRLNFLLVLLVLLVKLVHGGIIAFVLIILKWFILARSLLLVQTSYVCVCGQNSVLSELSNGIFVSNDCLDVIYYGKIAIWISLHLLLVAFMNNRF